MSSNIITLPEIFCPHAAIYSRPFYSARMPLPPSVNGAYTNAHIEPAEAEAYNRIVGSKRLNQFKKDAAKELLAARCDRAVIEAIYSAFEQKKYVPLAVSVRFFFREMWKRDIDGGLKYVIDAAFEAMALDDVLVVKIRDIDKEVNRADPHTEIDVCCLLQK